MVGDSTQIDPTGEASVAVFTLPAVLKAAQAVSNQAVVQSAGKKALSGATLAQTSADIQNSSSHNFLAAAGAGVAIVAVQLHQWRKRKANAAANKLAGLLAFDPLAVWLDGPLDKEP